MKRTVRLSLGMCFIMLALVLIAPHLASPKLVLRFLPKDVYEAGKDHPSPSLPKRLLCHLLLAMAAAYMVWAYKDVAEGIKRDRLSFGEAYKRLLAFLLEEKAFDIVCLDQILCMSTDYYQRCNINFWRIRQQILNIGKKQLTHRPEEPGLVWLLNGYVCSIRNRSETGSE